MKKRNPDIQCAHNALQHYDKKLVLELLNSVNLSKSELEIIYKTEIEHIKIKELCSIFCLEPESIMRIKTIGMKKIALFLFSSDIKYKICKNCINLKEKLDKQ